MKLRNVIFEVSGFRQFRLRKNLHEADDQRLKELGFGQFKKTEPIWAIQADEPFTVDTLEGDDISGKAGDWLCVGSEGEIWPIDQDIFEKTYEEV